MNNRKWIGMLAFVALFGLMSSAPSLAAIVNPGDSIVFSAAPNRDGSLSGGGGAFLITDTTSGFSWYSFCLERNEYISFGPTYKVGSVGPDAVNGGDSGGNPDPISSQTAYLYYLYATGGLWSLPEQSSGQVINISRQHFNMCSGTLKTKSPRNQRMHGRSIISI